MWHRWPARPPPGKYQKGYGWFRIYQCRRWQRTLNVWKRVCQKLWECHPRFHLKSSLLQEKSPITGMKTKERYETKNIKYRKGLLLVPFFKLVTLILKIFWCHFSFSFSNTDNNTILSKTWIQILFYKSTSQKFPFCIYWQELEGIGNRPVKVYGSAADNGWKFLYK